MRKTAYPQGSPGARGHGAADPSSLAQASAPASRPARRRADVPRVLDVEVFKMPTETEG
jgi:hypothetical protein